MVNFLKTTPCFDGKASNYFSWKGKIIGNKKIFTVTDEQFMAGMYNYFEGDAANWLKNTTFDSYEEFWNVLDIKYQSDKDTPIRRIVDYRC